MPRPPHACTATDGNRCYCKACWQRISAEREDQATRVRDFLGSLKLEMGITHRLVIDGVEGRLGGVAVLLCGENWMIYRQGYSDGSITWRRELVTGDRAAAYRHARSIVR